MNLCVIFSLTCGQKMFVLKIVSIAEQELHLEHLKEFVLPQPLEDEIKEIYYLKFVAAAMAVAFPATLKQY